MTKTYSTKSNALRAAKSAGFTKEQVEILGADGAFYFGEIEAKSFEQMVQEVHDAGTRVRQNLAEVVEKDTGVRHAEVSVPEVAQPVSSEQSDEKDAHKSSIFRPCKAVWHIADELKGSSRKEVLAECVARGIAYNTARTQYQQWFQVNRKS